MKTAFYLFDLAETASMPADVKAELYALAYKVGDRPSQGWLGQARGGLSEQGGV